MRRKALRSGTRPFLPGVEEKNFRYYPGCLRYLKSRGASFFNDIVEGTKLLRSQVEESLAELVAQGLVVSDSFTGLRALLTPSHRKTNAAARRKHRQPTYDMATAGRWSILQRSAGIADVPSATGRRGLAEELEWEAERQAHVSALQSGKAAARMPVVTAVSYAERRKDRAHY